MQPVVDQGRLTHDVEFVHVAGLGLPLPGGSAHAVEQAFAELLEQGVVAVLGPAISDNALVVQPLADRAAVPCINYTGSDETRSEYMFQFQIGSLEDEPSFLAAHLAQRGLTRVALVRDRSYVGRRMAEFFEDAAGVEGITMVTRDDADAIVSLGMWDTARALAEEKPDVPVVANSALIYGYHDPSAAALWDGWGFPDTISEDNALYAALGDGAGPGVAGQYDMGRLIAEGLARARVATGRGVMEGLERVKSIPSATGEAGTLMGFGQYERGALKGRYLVIRQWKDGQSVSWT
jgi:branched-chain amino acid transport system substrate-binding protein